MLLGFQVLIERIIRRLLLRTLVHIEIQSVCEFIVAKAPIIEGLNMLQIDYPSTVYTTPFLCSTLNSTSEGVERLRLLLKLTLCEIILICESVPMREVLRLTISTIRIINWSWLARDSFMSLFTHSWLECLMFV